MDKTDKQTDVQYFSTAQSTDEQIAVFIYVSISMSDGNIVLLVLMTMMTRAVDDSSNDFTLTTSHSPTVSQTVVLKTVSPEHDINR